SKRRDRVGVLVVNVPLIMLQLSHAPPPLVQLLPPSSVNGMVKVPSLMMVTCNSTVTGAPQGCVGSVRIWNGVRLLRMLAAGMAGYAALPTVTSALGVVERSTTL